GRSPPCRRPRSSGRWSISLGRPSLKGAPGRARPRLSQSTSPRPRHAQQPGRPSRALELSSWRPRCTCAARQEGRVINETRRRRWTFAAAMCLAGAAGAGDWTFYRHDLSGTSNASEALTVDQAAGFTVKWSKAMGGVIGNPVVAGGTVFVTGADGSL